MLRIFLLSVLLITSLTAFAGSLEPLKLRLPADSMLLRTRCEIAFQQALLDKQTYERQPHINLTCAFTIRPEIMNQMKQSFIVHCLNTIDIHARQATEYRITLEKNILQTSFDEVYGLVFRRDCLDKSVSEYASRAAGSRTSTAPSAASCGGKTCQPPISNR